MHPLQSVFHEDSGSADRQELGCPAVINFHGPPHGLRSNSPGAFHNGPIGERRADPRIRFQNTADEKPLLAGNPFTAQKARASTPLGRLLSFRYGLEMAVLCINNADTRSIRA